MTKLNQLYQLKQWIVLTTLFFGMACFFASNANANCSREIQVPIPSLNTSNKTITGELKRDEFSAHVILLMDGLGEKLGCTFKYILVPKARQEYLFENGKADILFLATKTAKRDEFGQLLSLFQIRPAIISNKSIHSSILSLKSIKEDQNIRLVLVRGSDYGNEYQALIELIDKQKRVSYEADAFSVARMMSFNKNVVTIMGPSIFEDVLSSEKALSSLINNIQYDEISEFPWTDVGIYISNFSLEEKDSTYLKQHLPIFLGNDRIWTWLQKKYSNEIVRISFRQVNANSSKK